MRSRPCRAPVTSRSAARSRSLAWGTAVLLALVAACADGTQTDNASRASGERALEPEVCTDADGDSFGAPGLSVCPAGSRTDCDDADTNTHPDALEVNDGRDNQCSGDYGFGEIDELSGELSIGPAPSYPLCWPAQPGATAYEIARSTTPSFTADCSTVTVTEICWEDPEIPPPGKFFSYLVRPLRPHAGSWGVGPAAQAAKTACSTSLCEGPECAAAGCWDRDAGMPKPAGSLCRPARSECDLAEACNGMSVECPADVPRPNGTACATGNACTTSRCQGGACVPEAGTFAEPGTPCTPEMAACVGGGACDGKGVCTTAAPGQICIPECMSPVATSRLRQCGDDGCGGVCGSGCGSGVCAGTCGETTDYFCDYSAVAGATCDDDNAATSFDRCSTSGSCQGLSSGPGCAWRAVPAGCSGFLTTLSAYCDSRLGGGNATRVLTCSGEVLSASAVSSSYVKPCECAPGAGLLLLTGIECCR